jgi:hypothetical protein
MNILRKTHMTKLGQNQISLVPADKMDEILPVNR